MPSNRAVALCTESECRRLLAHVGAHSACPTEAWGFFQERDRRKLAKAGFATPRGGRKGGYQNHVTRSGKVIVPFERLGAVSLDSFRNGFVVRLLPEQYFEGPGIVRPEFTRYDSPVKIGENAFVLYRTHDSYTRFPPPPAWAVRGLERNGTNVQSRGEEIRDTGEYILRLPRSGPLLARNEGPPQGMFATEYANEETNYLCKCVLAWLILFTVDSPYTVTQAAHLRAILAAEGLGDTDKLERTGVLRHGLCACPLCLRFVRYDDLHRTVSFDEADGLENAGAQVEGATRSTVVNLFHLQPLLYQSLAHAPENVAWGHAVCNTRLGQRRCYSLAELVEGARKVGVIRPEGIETFGWMSDDDQMIRSPNGAVWVQLNGDVADGPPAGGVPGATESLDDSET